MAKNSGFQKRLDKRRDQGESAAGRQRSTRWEVIPNAKADRYLVKFTPSWNSGYNRTGTW